MTLQAIGDQGRVTISNEKRGSAIHPEFPGRRHHPWVGLGGDAVLAQAGEDIPASARIASGSGATSTRPIFE